MPNWLVSREMSNAAKANDSENAQCGRDGKNVKKENTKKEDEDARAR